MAEVAVLVATGGDQPGIVDGLSQFLLECGVNITESRSVNLHGEFAMLMALHGEADAMQKVRGGLGALLEKGIEARLCDARLDQPAEATTFPFILLATGRDQSGVLHKLSHLLQSLKINIDNLETHVRRDLSFEIRLSLAVPREVPLAMLRDYLSYLCNELQIEWDLTEA